MQSSNSSQSHQVHTPGQQYSSMQHSIQPIDYSLSYNLSGIDYYNTTPQSSMSSTCLPSFNPMQSHYGPISSSSSSSSPASSPQSQSALNTTGSTNSTSLLGHDLSTSSSNSNSNSNSNSSSAKATPPLESTTSQLSAHQFNLQHHHHHHNPFYTASSFY